MLTKKRFIPGTLIPLTLAVLVTISGCSTANTGADGTTAGSVPETTTAESTENTSQQETGNKLMDDFDSLVSGNPKPADVMAFIAANIASVSENNASTMLLKLEESQKNSLSGLEGKFNDEAVQKNIGSLWKKDFDIDAAIKTADAKAGELLKKARNGGYKVETAEGMYFPIIDYSAYRPFSRYVTQDFKEYIGLMAVESDKVPAKDAALVISRDEVLQRALNQERFIAEFTESRKLDDVKQLYSKYVTFALYGLNNTPAFSYDTKVLDPEMKAAYEKFTASAGDSRLGKSIKDFMSILEKSGYKQTDKSDAFRKRAEEELKS